MAIPIETNNTNEGNDTPGENNNTRRSSNENNTLRPPREQEILFYHHTQRRNSRSVRSLASGSSTEVEGDTETSRPRDLMDVD
jgi:hypothetical protein